MPQSRGLSRAVLIAFLTGLFVHVLASPFACGPGVANPNLPLFRPDLDEEVSGGGGSGGGIDGSGESGGGAMVEEEVVEALSYSGTLSARVVGSRSTRDSESGEVVSAGHVVPVGQVVPVEVDAAGAVVTFLTLDGGPLLGADGEAIPGVVLDLDGALEAAGLPVGLDFVVAVDLEGDGVIDLQHIVHIAADGDSLEEEGGGATGRDEVVIDPLTTLVTARFRQLLSEAGVDSSVLGVSASAVMRRVTEAYTHLFAEAGLDRTLTLDDIRGLSEEEAAALFEVVIPPLARTGMEMAASQMALQRAGMMGGDGGVEGIALAAAETFLRAGFGIADEPGGLDFSGFADESGVLVLTREEYAALEAEGMAIEPGAGFGAGEPIGGMGPEGPSDIEAPENGESPAGQAIGSVTIYLSEVAEPDRNFSASGEGVARVLPLFRESLIRELAGLHAEGRRILLGDVYRILVDAELGFGGRFVYDVVDADDPRGRVLTFQTADGDGAALDVEGLGGQIAEAGFGDSGAGIEAFRSNQEAVRGLLSAFVVGTEAPGFEDLFGAIVTERIESVEGLSQSLRGARAHIGFNPSGPARFFVVADGDAFEASNSGDVVNPVTVDLAFGAEGGVSSATYAADGDGAYYLGFTPRTDEALIVEPILRSRGSRVRDDRGQAVRLSLADETVFAAVNGEAFSTLVSESGVFYPSVAVAVLNPGFGGGANGPPNMPPSTAPPGSDPGVEGSVGEPSEEELIEVHVLGSAPAPFGVPVRVDYDLAAGTASANFTGRYHLQFVPESNETGLFQLLDVLTGEAVIVLEAGDFSDPTSIEFIPTPVRVHVDEVGGLSVAPEAFTRVFGVEVDNENHDAAFDAFYDDIDGDGVEDAGEATFAMREFLFDPMDWRTTEFTTYYRRDDGALLSIQDVDFESALPATLDGVSLTPRNLKPRLNAHRFGRPNTALNLLTTFLRPRFFNGTVALDEETPVSMFGALATVNLVMDQLFNIEVDVDIDGPGPFGEQRTLVESRVFIIPVGDPLLLLVEGFEALSVVPAREAPVEEEPTGDESQGDEGSGDGGLGGGGDSTLDPGGEGRDPTEEFAEPDPAELAALAADLSGVSERILAVAGDLDEKARNLAALVENLVNNRAEFLVVSGRVGRIARDSRRAGEAVGLLSENLLFLATGVEPVGSSDQASEDGTAESEASGPDRAERLSLVGVKAALNRVNGELGALIDEQLFVVPISGSFAFEIDGFTELAGASAELSSATERFESATPGVVAGRE